jgi:hypothetical protein
VKQDRLAQAWDILAGQESLFRDFDYIYAWKAAILLKNNQPDAAEKILFSGLANAKSKHLLCERTGFFLFGTGELDKAVPFWIKSIVFMVQDGVLTRWEPFLYLARVAKACGSIESYHILMNQVADIFARGQLDLAAETIQKIENSCARLPVASMAKAIDCLCALYFIDPDIQVPEPDAMPSSGIPGPVPKKTPRFLFSGAILLLILICTFVLFLFFSKADPGSVNTPPAPAPILEKRPAANPAPKPEPVPEKVLAPLENPKEKPASPKTKTKSPDPDIKQKP